MNIIVHILLVSNIFFAILLMAYVAVKFSIENSKKIEEKQVIDAKAPEVEVTYEEEPAPKVKETKKQEEKPKSALNIGCIEELEELFKSMDK